MSELLVVQGKNVDDSAADAVFDIQEELRQFDQDDAWEIFEEFHRHEGWSIQDPPVVNMCSAYLLHGRTGEFGGLIEMVLIHRRLEERLQTGQFETIRFDGVDGRFRSLVADFADHHDVNLASAVDTGPNRVLMVLGILVGLVPVFLDQIVSFVLRLLWRPDDHVDTVFVPGRPKSTLPVLQAAEQTTEFTHAIITTDLTLKRIRDVLFSSQTETAASYDQEQIPLTGYVSATVLYAELKFLVSMFGEVVFDRQTEEDVSAFMQEAYGIRMDRSVRFLMDRAYTPLLFRHFLFYFLAENMARRTGCKHIVIGSYSTDGRAILFAGQKRGCEVHHIPHSVLTPCLPPMDGVTEYLEGEHSVSHLDEKSDLYDDVELVPSGRPYLIEMFSSQNSSEETAYSEPISVVIGTQPVDDNVRTEFVETVLDGIQSSPLDWEVTIKIHPGESTEFYAEYERENVSVDEGDIVEYIESSQLLVTMSSNVGIEAMVLGTPCTCVNFWEPVLKTKAYMAHESVPVLTSPDDVVEFFTNLDTDRLRKMQDDQHSYVTSRYELEGDPSEEILPYLTE